MDSVKKLLTTKRKVKLFDRGGALWETIESPLGPLAGLPKVVTMAGRVFLRHGEEYRECPDGELRKASLPYFVGLSGR